MAKDLRIAYLLDFYGDMLTGTQREVTDAYYNQDLSLAEIAEDRDITRQGVRDAIKRAEQQLLEMEERLGLARRFQDMQKSLAAICDCAIAIQDPQRPERGGGGHRRTGGEDPGPGPGNRRERLRAGRETAWPLRAWRKN